MPHKFDDPLWTLTGGGGVLASGMKEEDDEWLEMSAWVRQRDDFGDERVAFHHGKAPGDLKFIDRTSGEPDDDCWMMNLQRIGGHDLGPGLATATAHVLVKADPMIGKHIAPSPPEERVQRVLQWTQVLVLVDRPGSGVPGA